MKYLATRRSGGKTTAAVAMLRDLPEGSAIMVATDRERNWLLKEYKLRYAQVITIEETERLRGRPADARLILDNVDLVLRFLISGHMPIDLITFTVDNDEDQNYG